MAKESLKSGQVLYFCLTGDVIFSEKYTKEVKEETGCWGKAQSTISKSFQAHPNFSEGSRGYSPTEIEEVRKGSYGQEHRQP